MCRVAQVSSGTQQAHYGWVIVSTGNEVMCLSHGQNRIVCLVGNLVMQDDNAFSALRVVEHQERQDAQMADM